MSFNIFTVAFLFCFLSFLSSASLPVLTALLAHSTGAVVHQPPRITAHPTLQHHVQREVSSYGVAPSPVCGYVDHNPLQPLECYDNEFCSPLAGGFGCCAVSSFSISNLVTLTTGYNCTYYAPTACYPFSSAAECTEDCTNTAVVCGSQFPNCFTAVSYLSSTSTVTAHWCDVISTSISVEGNWFILESTTSSFVANSSSTSSATLGPTTSFSLSQQSVHSSSGQVTAQSTQSLGTCLSVVLDFSAYVKAMTILSLAVFLL